MKNYILVIFLLAIFMIGLAVYKFYQFAVITPTSVACTFRTVNVLDYGAIPNDDIDDTDAINAAIRDCSCSGDMVYFPIGEYIVKTDKDPQIILPTVSIAEHLVNLTLFSNSAKAFLLSQSSNKLSVMGCSDPSNINLDIKNIGIICNAETRQTAFDLHNIEQATLRNCSAESSETAIILGTSNKN